MTSPHIQVKNSGDERLADIGRGIARSIIDRCAKLIEDGHTPERIILADDAAHAFGMFFARAGFGGRTINTLCGIPIDVGMTGGEPVVIVIANPVITH